MHIQIMNQINDDFLKSRFIKFMQSLSNSNNKKLVHLYHICHQNKQTPNGLNIARIESSITSCDIRQRNILTQMNKLSVAKSKDLDNDQWKINFMNELIDVVHQTVESGSSPKEDNDIICFLASESSFYEEFILLILYLCSF